jgi:hypothetical protein
LLFIQDLTDGVASQSANSFPNKFIDIKSDIWFALRLFLTLVQITLIKLKPLSASALLITIVLTIFLAFWIVEGDYTALYPRRYNSSWCIVFSAFQRYVLLQFIMQGQSFRIGNNLNFHIMTYVPP